MKCKGEILKQVDDIKLNFQKYTNFDTMFTNIDNVLEYCESNNLWEKTVYGINESITFICIYVLMMLYAEFDVTELLTVCKKYYDFIDNWFRENFEKYSEKKNIMQFMVRKCAEEIYELLKSEE